MTPRLMFLTLCLVVGATRTAEAQALPSLADRLRADSTVRWRQVLAGSFRVYLARGSAAERDANVLLDTIAAARRHVLGLLKVDASRDQTAADLFFVNSREDMQRIARRPLAGFIQAGEPTGVFAYSPHYHLSWLLRHELTHLYTFALWGTPRAGSWFVEGVAVWVGGDCQGHSSDAQVAAALGRNELPALSALAQRFRETREDIAMPAAGSIVEFLFAREGLDGLRQRWLRDWSPPDHPLGPRGSDVEARWRSHLATIRPAVLDVPRLIREGC